MLRHLLITVALSVSVALSAHAQSAGDRPAWAQNAPTTTERFVPGTIAKDHWSFTPTFTPDLQTLYYFRWKRPDLPIRAATIQKLYTSRYVDGRWTEPVLVESTYGHRVDWPHVSPDGERLFLSYAKPHDGRPTFDPPVTDFDLWMATRKTGAPGDTVSFTPFRPITESPDLNRVRTPDVAGRGYVHNETGARQTLSGDLYFWTERLDDGGGRRDLYLARETGPKNDGVWAAPVLLPPPINTPAKESGLAVDPNGRWIIFASERPGGQGGHDLYVSFRTDADPATSDGWTAPRNLGPAVNSPQDEVVPEVSPDGRLLFFTSRRPIPGLDLQTDVDGDLDYVWNVYWVGLDALEPFAQTTARRGGP
jgi:hypothetical protein